MRDQSCDAVVFPQAFKEIWAELQTSNQEPLITFVVVQKRHGTRFFPDDPQAADENGNVKPGTFPYLFFRVANRAIDSGWQD